MLDPLQARPNGVLGPLLQFGTRTDGTCRWRPLDSTHHLVLAGPIEGGAILGMLAPAVQSRPDLRVGVLDLTAGRLDVHLLDVPGRLPAQDSRNVSDVLSAIGRLPDQAQPVLVVLAADDTDAADAALLACLRVALYRPVSVLLVVPARAAIPAWFRARCPVVEVRRRVAQWQAPEGRWDWAQPTVLRLPWHDPQLSWSHLPRADAPAGDAPARTGGLLGGPARSPRCARVR